MNSSQRLQYLFDKYMSGVASIDEQTELSQLVRATDQETISVILKNSWDKSGAPEEVLSPSETEDILQKILRKKPQEVPVRSIFKSIFFRASAAAILVLLAGATYLLVNKKNGEQTIASKSWSVINSIPPGGNRATLTLANGSTIILDSATNGTITQQGNTKILKLGNGQLAYNDSSSPLRDGGTEVLYNTIATPRGGQYQLTLADGSKVWLNAASSLRFPTSFVGKERNVELTGEGYFEVAHNASMPFKVNVAGKGEVEVLGTHFNINSYSDEATVNTTLLEGKVKVRALDKQQFISPGQQAQLNSDGKITVIKKMDLEEVVAWKNGFFQFDSASIETIMKQVSRWYDVQVVFEGVPPAGLYKGRISRDISLAQLLRVLEISDLHFHIYGNKIIIK